MIQRPIHKSTLSSLQLLSGISIAINKRYGHSAISPIILRIDDTGKEIRKGHLTLRDFFMNPTPVLEDGIESILRGVLMQVIRTNKYLGGTTC